MVKYCTFLFYRLDRSHQSQHNYLHTVKRLQSSRSAALEGSELLLTHQVIPHGLKLCLGQAMAGVTKALPTVFFPITLEAQSRKKVFDRLLVNNSEFGSSWQQARKLLGFVNDPVVYGPPEDGKNVNSCPMDVSFLLFVFSTRDVDLIAPSFKEPWCVWNMLLCAVATGKTKSAIAQCRQQIFGLLPLQGMVVFPPNENTARDLVWDEICEAVVKAFPAFGQLTGLVWSDGENEGLPFILQVRNALFGYVELWDEACMLLRDLSERLFVIYFEK